MTPLDRVLWVGAVMRDHGLSEATLRVAGVLPEFINGKLGTARPGLDFLASQCGLHRSTTARALASLVLAGHLEKHRGGGRGKASEYRLKLSHLAATVSSHKTVALQSDSLGQNPAPETVAQTVAQTVAPAATLQGYQGKDLSNPSQTQPLRARARPEPAKKKGSRNGRTERLEDLASWCASNGVTADPARPGVGNPGRPVRATVDERLRLDPDGCLEGDARRVDAGGGADGPEGDG